VSGHKLLLRSETLQQQTITSRALDEAWGVVLDAASHAETFARHHQHASLALGAGGRLCQVETGHQDAVIAWRPHTGFELLLAGDDPRRALIDLYLPICSATDTAPITVGHLGQSLDGFIATHSGESQYVTGEENILHLHRMRALCDAVVVGAGTIAADDPQLTTRHVPGPSPLRVVLDPTRRLAEHYKVFTDDSAVTLYVCARPLAGSGETHVGHAEILALDEGPDGVDVGQVLRELRRRGCHRIFVEGGGVTVSMFLEASLLDRLHVAVAPLIIGDGRPAIRLPARAALGDCHRPPHRVFRMGGDVLFDFDLRGGSNEPFSSGTPSVDRII